MSLLRSFILLAFLCLCSDAKPRPPAQNFSKAGGAVYFITNSAKNAVAAVSISRNGTLAGGTLIPTGGKGSAGIDGATNAPAATDGLFSQSSLSIAGKSIFVVNAGSNTITMFNIDAADPTKLTEVGKPAVVPGDFVNTVAASQKNKLVCAGATGARAGIACANFDVQSGIGQMDLLREFHIQQSTPPIGPTNTLSQVFWSDDERTLFATVKGDPARNNTGFLATFSVQRPSSAHCRAAASLAKEAKLSSPKGTAVLFGALPIPGTDNIFATDASFGAAILSVSSCGQGSLKAAQPIDGQKATCWVTISDQTKSAFVTDVVKPRLVEMSLRDAKIISEVDLGSTGVQGFIDLKARGTIVYALAPGNATKIMVVDVGHSGKHAKVIQAFSAGALGAGALSQGMAVFEQA